MDVARINLIHTGRTALTDELCYTLLEPALPGRVRFTFAGRFENQDLHWDATLLALAPDPDSGGAAGYRVVRQFIDIGELTSHGRAIVIGLGVPTIDEAVIQRTIIMVRQYKRLHPGRHEFGEAFVSPFPHTT